MLFWCPELWLLVLSSVHSSPYPLSGTRGSENEDVEPVDEADAFRIYSHFLLRGTQHTQRFCGTADSELVQIPASQPWLVTEH